MYILLAILKFLLAKSLKFSQKKKEKKRADFCGTNVRLSDKQKPIHANQPHKFCGLIYLFSEPLCS